MKSLTNELEKEWAFKSDCLVLFDEIKTKFPEIELLIPQMRRQQRVILFEVFGKKVLKFIDNKHSNSVTDIDRGVSALKITFTKLETQLSRLLREQLAYVFIIPLEIYFYNKSLVTRRKQKNTTPTQTKS